MCYHNTQCMKSLLFALKTSFSMPSWFQGKQVPTALSELVLLHQSICSNDFLTEWQIRTVQTTSILVQSHNFITLLSARSVSCKCAHTTCFCNAIFFFCISTIKTALFQSFVCQICSVGSVVRAVRYITGRSPVLIQAVRFCPSGESARTLFKSSESKPTLTNKQNSPLTQSLREAQPLLHPVCANESFFTFA